MKVFVLIWSPPYEPSWLEGVYATAELAQEVVEKIERKDYERRLPRLTDLGKWYEYKPVEWKRDDDGQWLPNRTDYEIHEKEVITNADQAEDGTNDQ